jgi:hypothetical protein
MALDELAVRPITQFPITLDDEVSINLLFSIYYFFQYLKLMLFLADAGREICQLQRSTDRYYEKGKYFCLYIFYKHV